MRGAPLSPYEPIGLDGLGRLLGDGLTVEDIGHPDRVPILRLDLDASEGDVHEHRLLESLPVVVLGTAHEVLDQPPPCDILLCEQPDPPRPWTGCEKGTRHVAEELIRSVCEHPIASVVLVQLLRLGHAMPVVDALVAESLAYSTLQAGPEHRAWLAARAPRRHRAHKPDPVLLERSGGSLGIVRNRPDVHNALDAAMRDELVAALRVAVADPSIDQVTLSGAGPSFCSGGDLDEFGTAPDPATAHIVRTTRSPARWVHACAQRCIVNVHGTCIGAGVELAAFARMVSARPGSTFTLPEVGMGLVPGAGGTVSLPRRMGRERTAYLALSGTTIDAATALSWGLVDEIGG